MSFWTDLIRIVGVITAPVLIATGVGTPLGLVIGGLAAGGANYGADAIDKAVANSEADDRAEKEKQEASARIKQHEADALNFQRQKEKEIRQQLEQAELTENVMSACRNGYLDQLRDLFSRLTNVQFSALGMTPLMECKNQEDREQVLAAVQSERERRGL